MSQIIIEKMRLSDIPRIMELEFSSFTLPWTQENFEQELTENQYAHYFIGKLDGEIVSYCGSWVVYEDCNITTIATDPVQRGKGFGKELLIHTLNHAAMIGAEVATLEVRISNQSARALYKSLGFVDVALRKNYYKDNNEDAFLMWVNLNGK